MNLLVATFVLLSAVFPVDDFDRDTIPDEVEQQLLIKFAPSFIVSSDDCDGLPSEFMPDTREPRLVAKNGTIYGQVFRQGAHTEIHYYHLWSRDCGMGSHARDPEHVSVLLSEDNKALYWYAAAHEGTICDASSGAKGLSLEAEDHGIRVWISRGKHASFLSSASCRLGCGGDQCRNMGAMPAGKIINIGEKGAPLNGATWIASKKWSLYQKMKTDFSDGVIAQLEKNDRGEGTAVNDALSPVKGIVLGGNSAIDAAVTGNRRGGEALFIGGKYGVKGTSLALKKTGRALGRVLGLLR